MGSAVVVSKQRVDARRANGHQDFYDYYDTLPIGAYRVKPNGEILAANPALLWMLGYSSLRALKAFPLQSLKAFPHSSWPEMRRRLEALENIRGLESTWRRKDGSSVITRENLWVVRAPTGSLQYFEGTVFDVTGRKADEALLVFRSLFESVPVGFVQIDLDGRIQETNRAFDELLGANDELRKRDYVSVSHVDDQPTDRDLLAQLASGAKDHYKREKRVVRKDGSIAWVHETVSLVRDARRTPRFVCVVVEDITERKLAEDDVRNRTHELEAANKELEAFAYTVSHDLRTPLRAIASYTEILLDEHGGNLDENGRLLFERIRGASHRMAQLIEDLLQLSRITRTEVKREPINLSVVARDVVHGLRARSPRRTVVCTIQPKLELQADPHLMKIVLENLLGNAWKFTAKTKRARVEFGTTRTKDGLAYFVRDNGAGFEMASAGKLFEPFNRLHKPEDFEGNGIGLATVKRIVHRHGGKVWAEGQVNHGATIYFKL